MNQHNLDTTGLRGKDRILALAEIIKAHQAGGKVELKLGDDYHWVPIDSPDFSSVGDYRIKKVSKTYYVNLYPSGTRFPNQSYTISTTEQDARNRAAVEGGARTFAVAVPVTIEEFS